MKNEGERLSIVCNSCIYHLRNVSECLYGNGYMEGKSTNCSYYYSNPQNIREWLNWCKFLIGNKIMKIIETLF